MNPENIEALNNAKEAMNGMLVIFWIIAMYWVIIVITMYILPSLIVIFQNKKNKIEIICTNIFLWWTFIGWVVALIMSLKKEENIIINIDLKDFKNEIKNEKITLTTEDLRKIYWPK